MPVFVPVELVLGLAGLVPVPAPGPLPVLEFEEQGLPPVDSLARADRNPGKNSLRTLSRPLSE